MHKHDHQEPDMNVLEKMGYEASDIAAGKAAKAVGWTAGLTIFTFAVSWGIIGLVEGITGAEARVDPKKPLAGFARTPQEPYPLLQSNRTAHKDMVDLMAKEKEALQSYGPAEPGRVRIPIDRAVAKTLEKGLPVRAAASEEEPR
jgi:hypothetical protein